MLQELYVENFALIEKLQVNFQDGFNVLTGETGAGKSLIIDAVGILIGGRPSQDMVRTGAKRAFIQGSFQEPFHPDTISFLEEAGFEIEDGVLVLSREIKNNGKHTCRVNYRVVPVSLFREIGRKMINIHGQHEHVALLEEENQRLLLDSFGGDEVLHLREEVKNSYFIMQELRSKLDGMLKNTQESERKKDLLHYQINEIENAALRLGEEEELRGEKKVLQNAEKLMLDCRSAYEKLYGSREQGAVDLVGEAERLLNPLGEIDQSMGPIAQRLNEVYYLLEDVVRDIAGYQDSIVSNPMRLEQVERRLLEIKKLQKKYGETVEEILQFAENAKRELEDLEHTSEKTEELEKELKREEERYHILSKRLTAARKKTGEKLSGAVTGELHQLQMPSAKFLVRMKPAEAGPQGVDSIQFLISPNVGEDIKPVARIASGGEMSRIMLGIKVVLARLDRIPTLIFDEIDSGLGGRVVYAVGEKLSLIGEYTQIICVTHSPVVASFANRHLFISKKTMGERTITDIIRLNEKGVLLELGRMLAGDNASEITLAQASELLETGQKRKKPF
ncbi:MAG: DNA repair protein RecN [Desulfitobacteriaceae bacterium]|nr:DNA repair protein RecN [Desulfitobacteriaceae bacterium]